MTLAQQPFALRETLTAAVHLFIPLAEAKGLALSLDMSPDLPSAVIGDAQRFTQIIGNLPEFRSTFIHYTKAISISSMVRNIFSCFLVSATRRETLKFFFSSRMYTL